MAAAAFEKVREQKQQEHDRYKENLQLLEKERAVSAATEETNTTKPLSPPSKATSSTTSTSTSHPAKHPTAPQPTKRTTHGLGFLQMPGNLLEMEGVLRTAKWAKGQGLRVFVNRPLNAMSPEYGAVRLASYPEPQSPTYEQAHRELLDTFSTLSHQRVHLAPNIQRLTEDIEELDSTLKANNLSAIHLEGASIRNQLHQELSKPIKHKHGASTSATVPQPEGEVSERLSQPIVKETHPSPPPSPTTPSPSHSSSSSQMASNQELEGVIKLMDKYIHAFQQQVRFQETGRVSAMLAERGIDLEGEPIEQFALEYLLEHEQVDAVLLGMKREPYVDFARKTLQKLARGSSSL